MLLSGLAVIASRHIVGRRHRARAAPGSDVLLTYTVPTKAWALKRVVGVLAAGTDERLHNRPAVAPGDVPRSPRDVSPEWLSAVLCAGTPGARVIAVAVTAPGIGTTTRASLELTYNEAGAAGGLPTRVFVKCTTGLAQRIMLGLGGLIHGEPGFYAHVRPLVEIEAPLGYHGAVAARSWRSIVVMEDVVRTRGARFWRPSSSLSRPQIEDLLASAARWHGALWDSPRLGEWKWLKTPAEQMAMIDALLSLADRTRAGVQRAHGVIPARLSKRQHHLQDALRASMWLASQGPLTYLHGDLHIANTYTMDERTMGVCDWQTSLRGSWVHDYAYLVATSLEVEDRREWERDLLAFYLEQLAAAGGPSLATGEAWNSYRQALFYPYFAWLYTLGRSRLQPNFQPAETGLALVRRLAAAIDDLASFAAIGV